MQFASAQRAQKRLSGKRSASTWPAWRMKMVVGFGQPWEGSMAPPMRLAMTMASSSVGTLLP